MGDIEITNPLRQSLYRWCFLFLLSIILFFYGAIDFDINSFDGALIMVSILFALTSLILIPITMSNMRIIDAGIRDRKLIAEWRYTKREWQDFLERERRFRLKENTGKYWLVSIILVVVFVPFIIFMEEGKFFMFVVMVIHLVILGFFAFVWPNIKRWKERDSTGYVLIFDKGLLLHKTYHSWKSKLTGLISVEHKKGDLEIIYEFVDRLGVRNYLVLVPIPKKVDDTQVKKVVKALTKK